MADYMELVKQLREYGDIWRDQLLHQAADAITELVQKLHELEQNSIPKHDAEIIISEIAKPKWVPVTERLPDVWSDVLVAVLKHRPKSEPVRTMAVDFITMTGEWAKMSCDCRNEVTHWMPLPEPPKEE